MIYKNLKPLARVVLLLLSCHVACAQAFDIKTSPTDITNVYSDIDMKMRLAIKPNDKACSGEQCALNHEFDLNVQRLGERLAVTAYRTYPDLIDRIPKFTISVADKKEPGIASNGSGKIVVFRGIQYMELSDDAVSLILAREMGHVIGFHHKKNTSTKILFSVLASVLFPAATLLSASHVAAEATTTVVTSVASTATSYFGSEVAISKIRPNQRVESDNIAITLLDAQGWDRRAVVSLLQPKELEVNGWLKDLKATRQYLSSLTDKADI